ncbi:MAG: hypothetical protein LBD14_01550 [Puniceicoccales bacterium]|jgi:hypothetical protein|nr:hypothetical protein [Puniceicoccales bacterium]
MNTAIDITDTATPKLQKLIGTLTQRQPLMERLGRAFEAQLRDHFLAKNQEPNKRGWPKQNLWARVRRATAFSSATNDTATVTITDPAFRDKIAPAGTYTKSSGLYAIPLRREAAGITPRSKLIPGFFMLRAHGKLFLATREAPAAGRKRATRGKAAPQARPRLTLYYILSKTRRHSPDPTALPPREEIIETLTRRTQAYLSNI